MSIEAQILDKIAALPPAKRSALLQLLTQWSKPAVRTRKNVKIKNPLGAAKGIGRDLSLKEFKSARRKAWRFKGA